MATVTVRGSALAAVTPDRAELSLALSHLAADAAGALDEVAARSQRLEQILTEHGFAHTDWATDGVTIAEEFQWKNDTNVLVGHRATTGLTVTIRSSELVGPVIRDAVTITGASVRNLVWRVDADNPARKALLAAAARDAKVRASAYVEALGLRLGEVDSISEAPLVQEPGPMPQPRMMAAAKMGDGPELSVSGGLVELHADVNVRFAILA
jgi:uncharacterized protein YggE